MAAKKLVFLLDDMPILSKLYSEVLARHGYDTAIVTSSDEAYSDLLKRPKKPACLVLDVNVMGSMTGIELCKKLRDEPDYQRVPIIMLTANPSCEEDARTAGADAFFTKPCKLDAFVEVIDAVTAI
ncbi:MAG: response regulator [Deltaproteobacteria bacterium]|nr:response regulator [Deltaproteobacteria bacterium]